MTAASDIRQGRRLAREIAKYDEINRERVLSYQPTRVRDAAIRHLAVLDHITEREQAS